MAQYESSVNCLSWYMSWNSSSQNTDYGYASHEASVGYKEGVLIETLEYKTAVNFIMLAIPLSLNIGSLLDKTLGTVL